MLPLESAVITGLDGIIYLVVNPAEFITDIVSLTFMETPEKSRAATMEPLALSPRQW